MKARMRSHIEIPALGIPQPNDRKPPLGPGSRVDTKKSALLNFKVEQGWSIFSRKKYLLSKTRNKSILIHKAHIKFRGWIKIRESQKKGGRHPLSTPLIGVEFRDASRIQECTQDELFHSQLFQYAQEEECGNQKPMRKQRGTESDSAPSHAHSGQRPVSSQDTPMTPENLLSLPQTTEVVDTQEARRTCSSGAKHHNHPSTQNASAPLVGSGLPHAKGYYAEYQNKFLRQDGLIPSGKSSEDLDPMPIHPCPPPVVGSGTKTFLRTLAGCILGIILTVILVHMFASR